MNLQGVVAVVTGAAGTIGGEIVDHLTREGATVARWDLNVTDSAYVVCDVSDRESVNDAFDHTIEKFGVPTVLVNAAGVSGGKAPRAIDATDDDWPNVLSSPQAWNATFKVNVLGPVNTSRRFAELVARNELSGAIVNVTSMSGGPLNDGVLAAYSASKAAADKVTRLAAAEFGRLGIRVNAVAPGAMEVRMRFTGTDSAASKPGQAGGGGSFEDTLKATPIEQRAARASDVADAVLALLRLDFVTGEIVQVDGGLMLGRSSATSG